MSKHNKKSEVSRRSGLVVAMFARHVGGKHVLKKDKRSAQKAAKVERNAY